MSRRHNPHRSAPSIGSSTSSRVWVSDPSFLCYGDRKQEPKTRLICFELKVHVIFGGFTSRVSAVLLGNNRFSICDAQPWLQTQMLYLWIQHRSTSMFGIYTVYLRASTNLDPAINVAQRLLWVLGFFSLRRIHKMQRVPIF